MKLRNRSVGIGGTFYPFKRLPIELRQMIWRLTLRGRLVEVIWGTDQDFGENADLVGDNLPTDIKFVSYAEVPVTLGVCRDSRAAVSPFYPLCFPSATQGPKIRFNFSMDSILLHQFIEPFIDDFFLHLTPLELTKVQYVHLDEALGISVDEAGWFEAYEKYWKGITAKLDRLTALKTVHLVLDVMESIDTDGMESTKKAKVENDVEMYTNSSEVSLVIFNTYPKDFIERYQLKPAEKPRKKATWLVNKKLLKKMRLVWGLRFLERQQFDDHLTSKR